MCPFGSRPSILLARGGGRQLFSVVYLPQAAPGLSWQVLTETWLLHQGRKEAMVTALLCMLCHQGQGSRKCPEVAGGDLKV